MSWLDVLLGRTKPVKSRVEQLFAMSTAQVTLEVKLGVKPTGEGGITFRPVTTASFDSAASELKGLLDVTTKETGIQYRITKDEYGFEWVLLKGQDLEGLVSGLHMASQTLQDHGLLAQLLAAVFPFVDREEKRLFWIYNYKRGSFYPFVPLPGKSRDNAYELRVRDVMEGELPLEPELERWYPLWDIPLSRESDPRS
jgi:hypothetical protein